VTGGVARFKSYLSSATAAVWAVPGPVRRPPRPLDDDHGDGRAIATSGKAPGHSLPTIRVTTQGWTSGKVGRFLPTGQVG
jgi:hypothetical protein